MLVVKKARPSFISSFEYVYHRRADLRKRANMPSVISFVLRSTKHDDLDRDLIKRNPNLIDNYCDC